MSDSVRTLLVILAVTLELAGCGKKAAPVPTPSAREASASPATKPIDLGKHSRRITTSSPDAQAAFDRGLVLAYAFNHAAAERAFREAAERDPSCAMAWWGVGLVNGPHINNPFMSPQQVATATDAVARARGLAAHTTPVEQALIEALATRYAADPAAPREPLDQAYAGAMRTLRTAHPDDPDVAALEAEALMDLHPWDLWTAKGAPRPWTSEILTILEGVLALAPDHPLANHLYIHAVEGSPRPERGVAAADRLRDLVPGAGHLVHMPGHIYVRVGRWAEASAANQKAIAADAAWRAENPQDPAFYVIYMAHNHLFLAFSEMMRGRGGSALRAARDMVAGIPSEFLAGPGGAFADGFLPIPTEVLVRFGRWKEVLAEADAPGGLPISTVMRHFLRATALTALDRLDEADQERAAFQAAAAAIAPGAFVGNNAAAPILGIAAKVLAGEMAARRKEWPQAIAALREAAAMEDALNYDEPPDWMQPVRHSLGAVLLNAGKARDAEHVYRADLVRYPENGWSLFGLERALRLQGKMAEADAVAERFQRAWADADMTIGASCVCQPPA
jgi:tetratricopeptide (TPR) repeat protein